MALKICFKVPTLITFLYFGLSGAFAAETVTVKIEKDYNVKPVAFNNVNVSDNFWLPRLQTNRKVTIPFTFEKCEETGRIRNFKKAASLIEGNFEGTHFDDSDVYKIMEGAAYSLQVNPDPQLRKYLEDLIDVTAKAQWDDGYLFTFYSVPEKQPEKRWTNIQWIHELYCAGHMYEAAVAHYQVTGNKKFLDIATKNADLICDVFGPGKRTDPPGHQEIEIGLAKLYRVTGDKKYLEQAKFFLDQRGKTGNRGPDGKGGLYGTYNQDHKPVIEQTTAVGHSVRAAYMYTGMADVAALTGNMDYVRAIERIWQNAVGKKLYITGGIGAAGGHEGFGGEYELPNMNAYCETCASVANIMWNHRMFLMTGDAKYIDVLERTLYNSVLSGISMNGDRFFYPNPLESIGQHSRAGWFSCACCPSNITRFIPSIPGYAYASKDNNVYLNLYIGSDATIGTDDNKVKVIQKTNYPWDGNVKITIEPEKSQQFAVYVRIPCWAQNKPVPGDLYHYLNKSNEKVTLKVNGKAVELNIDKGYVSLDRKWKKADTIELSLPMPIRRVIANEKVQADRGKTAIERGPVAYCLEWTDNDGKVLNLMVPDDAELRSEYRADLLNGVVVITGTGRVVGRADSGNPEPKEQKQFTAIPYYAWAHRGRGEMTVWPARVPESARPEPANTITYQSKITASFVHASLDSIKDQVLPKSSFDSSALQLDFWPHKGTSEWLQFEWDTKHEVGCMKIYWFDDTGRGECHLPKSWKVLYRDDNDKWLPVINNTAYLVEKDKLNKVRFKPVHTDAIKIEILLQKNWAAGIYEVIIEQ